MKERIKKLLPWVVYPIFYLTCLVVFAVLTFPFDKAKERVVASFNTDQRARGAQASELQIGELSGYWLTGVKLKGVKLLSLSKEPGKPPTELKVDEARARVSLLSYLFGTTDITFQLKGFGGEVEGTFVDKGKGKDRSVDLKLDGIDLGQVDPLVAAIELPLEGKVSGTVNFLLPEGKASKGNGTVNLEAKDVAVGDGKAKIKGLLALPKLTAGTLSFVAEAKDGQLKLTKLGASGKDLELQGEGRIQMRELATDSLLDVQVRFKINDGYRSKSENTKSLFGSPESKIPPLFEMDPKVKQSKRSDGFYGWHLRGPLGRPDFQPNAGSAIQGLPGSSPGR